MKRAWIWFLFLPSLTFGQDLLFCDTRGLVYQVDAQTLTITAQHQGLGDVELLDQCWDSHAWLVRRDTQSLIRLDLQSGLKQVLTLGQDVLAAAASADGGIVIVTAKDSVSFGQISFLSPQMQILSKAPAMPGTLDLCVDEKGQLWQTIGRDDQPGALVQLGTQGENLGYWQLGTWPHRVICHGDGVVWVHCQRSSELWRLDSRDPLNTLQCLPLEPEVEDFAVDIRGNLFLVRPLSQLLEFRDETGQLFYLQPTAKPYDRLLVNGCGDLWLWSEQEAKITKWTAGMPGPWSEFSPGTTHFQPRSGGHHFLSTSARLGDLDGDGSSNIDELIYGTDLSDSQSALDRIYSNSGFIPGAAADLQIQSLATPEALVWVAAAWTPSVPNIRAYGLPLSEDGLFHWSLTAQGGGPWLALIDALGRASLSLEVPMHLNLQGQKFWLAFMAFQNVGKWVPKRLSPAFEMEIQ